MVEGVKFEVSRGNLRRKLRGGGWAVTALVYRFALGAAASIFLFRPAEPDA
jgi:hypothetical protein